MYMLISRMASQVSLEPIFDLRKRPQVSLELISDLQNRPQVSLEPIFDLRNRPQVSLELISDPRKRPQVSLEPISDLRKRPQVTFEPVSTASLGFGGKLRKNFRDEKRISFLFYDFFFGRPPFLPFAEAALDRSAASLPAHSSKLFL